MGPVAEWAARAVLLIFEISVWGSGLGIVVQTSRRLCRYDHRLMDAPVVARQNWGQHRDTSVTISDTLTIRPESFLDA
jgi:hypothetical protein